MHSTLPDPFAGYEPGRFFCEFSPRDGDAGSSVLLRDRIRAIGLDALRARASAAENDLLNLGIKNAARVETVVVGLKVLVVLLVIGVGFFHIKTGNYHPFFPYGWSGAFTGAATVFFAPTDWRRPQ